MLRLKLHSERAHIGNGIIKSEYWFSWYQLKLSSIWENMFYILFSSCATNLWLFLLYYIQVISQPLKACYENGPYPEIPGPTFAVARHSHFYK